MDLFLGIPADSCDHEHHLVPMKKLSTHLCVLNRTLVHINPFVARVYASKIARQRSRAARRQMNVYMWRVRDTEFWI